MAPLRCAAKLDPFLSLDCAPTPSTLAQSKERKGFCHLVTLPAEHNDESENPIAAAPLSIVPSAGVGPIGDPGSVWKKNAVFDFLLICPRYTEAAVFYILIRGFVNMYLIESSAWKSHIEVQ